MFSFTHIEKKISFDFILNTLKLWNNYTGIQKICSRCLGFFLKKKTHHWRENRRFVDILICMINYSESLIISCCSSVPLCLIKQIGLTTFGQRTRLFIRISWILRFLPHAFAGWQNTYRALLVRIFTLNWIKR